MLLRHAREHSRAARATPLDARLPRINGAYWDDRVCMSPHPTTAWRASPTSGGSLSDVVRFDLPRLKTSAGSTSSTCSATSARTPSRSDASAPPSPVSTCPRRELVERRNLAAAAGPRGDVRAVQAVRRRDGARRVPLRPRVHRDRRAVLAARRSDRWARRRLLAAAPGRTPPPARGSPDALVASPKTRSDGLLVALDLPYFEQAGGRSCGTRRRLHLTRANRVDVHAEHHARVEPRAR